MTYRRLLHLLVLLLPALLTACGSGSDRMPTAGNGADTTLVHDTVPMSIRFGTSQGMCMGYCEFEYELRRDRLIGTRKAGGRSSTADYPTQVEEVTITSEQYAQVRAAVDADFWTAPEVIGCPDCADGGRCWIEIQAGERKKLVASDCMAGAGQVAVLAGVLRTMSHMVKWGTEQAPAEG